MKKQKSIMIFLLCILIMSLIGCTQTVITNGSIRLVNNSSYIITVFNITPTTATTWGSNQLGSSTLSPGNSFLVSDIPAGIYDLRAYLSGYGTIYHYDAAVEAGKTAAWVLSYKGISKEQDEESESVFEYYY